ncbi:ankyrin repeat-containing protein ITN1-like protein [Tanacetum coccineum]
MSYCLISLAMDTNIIETVEMQTRENLMEAGVLRSNDVLPKPQQKGLLFRTWARYVNNDQSWLEKQRGILILAALVVAGMAFHSGINPPGGFITNTQTGRYDLGNAVQTEEQVFDVGANHCNIVHGRVHGGYLSAVLGNDGS